jgi:hypothetical protein
MRIRIQGSDHQKLKKIRLKIIFSISKIYNLPPKETFKIQKNPAALKKEYPALQNMTFFHFFVF